MGACRHHLAGHVDPVSPGQVEVHDHHVGLQGSGLDDGVGAVLGLADELDVGFRRQHDADAVAEHRMVVDHEHAH